MASRHSASARAVFLVSLLLAAVVAVGMARSAKLSAQQTCFGNLALLAQATLLYVADNDGRFPPHEASPTPYTCQWGADAANPWLRWPVVLDPYVHDREAYLCPGAEAPREGHGVVTRPAWIAVTPITSKGWPNGPCGSVWPPGWGGAITDSAAQGPCFDANRFRTNLGAAVGSLAGARLADIESPDHHLLWADSSRLWLKLGSILYASACRADCATLDDKADWDNCPWSQNCGAGGDFATNPDLRDRFTRHNGGSNLAFVDGHLEWLTVPRIIAAYRSGNLKGATPAEATKGKPWYLK